MPNLFRVDRNRSTIATPVGMNSLLYLGDSESRARNAFRHATPGLNVWDQPDARYGVTLARWNEASREYVILERKD